MGSAANATTASERRMNRKVDVMSAFPGYGWASRNEARDENAMNAGGNANAGAAAFKPRWKPCVKVSAQSGVSVAQVPLARFACSRSPLARISLQEAGILFQAAHSCEPSIRQGALSLKPVETLRNT